MILAYKQFWWEASNAERIPAGILVALILGLRFFLIYRNAKNAPKRSPRVRRIEWIVLVSLWSIIAAGVVLGLLTQH